MKRGIEIHKKRLSYHPDEASTENGEAIPREAVRAVELTSLDTASVKVPTKSKKPFVIIDSKKSRARKGLTESRPRQPERLLKLPDIQLKSSDQIGKMKELENC